MAMHSHDIDSDDLDFAMLTPTTRPGPCRKALAEETDATAATLAREVEAAPFIAEAVGLAAADNRTKPPPGFAIMVAGEVAYYWVHSRPDGREVAGEWEYEFVPDAITDAWREYDETRPRAVEVRYGSGKVKV